MKRKRLIPVLSLLCLLLAMSLTAFAAEPRFVSETIQIKDTAQGVTMDFKTTSETEAMITKGKGTAASVVNVPETVTGKDGTVYTVTAVGDLAFWLQNLDTVNLPKTIRTIGKNAFFIPVYTQDGTPVKNVYIRHVNIPEDSVLESIGENAFNNTGLQGEFYLPGTVTSIAGGTSGAFGYNKELTKVTIGEGLTALPENMFKNCTKLSEVTLPSTLRTIGSGCFYGTAVETLDLSGVTYLPDTAFNGCSSLKNVTLRDVSQVGNSPFSGCSLASVTLAEGMTKVPDKLFYNCNTIDSVNFADSIREIGIDAFYWCKLGAVTLPDNMQTISDYAFRNCKLGAVTLPANVQTIGNYAFSGCGLTELTLPASVRTISDYAFSGNSLTELTLPQELETIGAYAFSGNPLTSLTLTPGVRTIGNDAFYNCKLTSIEIPPTVKTVGSMAFYCPTSLTYACYYPGTEVASNAFSTQNVDVIRPVETGETFKADGLTYLVLEGTDDPAVPGRVEVAGATYSAPASGVVPETVHYCAKEFTVVSIGEKAFSLNNNTTFTLPDTVDTIKDYAFTKSELVSISLPASVRSMGVGAFSECRRLNQVTIPENTGLTEIPDSAFYGSTSFRWCDMPSSIKHIGKSAFINTSVYTIDLSNVTSIGEGAFLRSGLSSVVLPGGCTFGSGVFSYCTNLYSVTVDGPITEISDDMFSGCSYLGKFGTETGITLPASVKRVGENAFYGCTNIKEIRLNEGLEEIGKSAFSNCRVTSLTIPGTVRTMGGSVIYSSTPVEITMLPMAAPALPSGAPFSGYNYNWTITKPEGSVGYYSGGWESYFFAPSGNGGGSNGVAFEQNGAVYDAGDVEAINITSTRFKLDLPSSDPAGWAEAGLVTWTEDAPRKIKTLDLTGFGSADFSSNLLDLSNLAGLTKAELPNVDYYGISLNNCTNLETLSLPLGGGAIDRIVLTNTKISDLAILMSVDSLRLLNVEGCTRLQELTVPIEGLEQVYAKNSGLTRFAAGSELKSANLTGCTYLDLAVYPSTANMIGLDPTTTAVKVIVNGAGGYQVQTAWPDQTGYLVELRQVPVGQNKFLSWSYQGQTSQDEVLKLSVPLDQQVSVVANFAGKGAGDPDWPVFPSNGGGSNGNTVAANVYDYQGNWTGVTRYFYQGDMEAFNYLIRNNGLSEPLNDPIEWGRQYGPAYWKVDEYGRDEYLWGITLTGAEGLVNLSNLTTLQYVQYGDMTGLDLSGCTHFGEKTFSSLYEMDKLEYLSLADCHFARNTNLQWAPSTLKVLNISGCKTMDDGFAEYAKPAQLVNLNTLLCCGTGIKNLDLSANTNLRLLVCDDDTKVTGIPDGCAVVRVKTEGRGHVIASNPGVDSLGNLRVFLTPTKCEGVKFEAWTQTAGNTVNSANIMTVSIPRGGQADVTATYVGGGSSGSGSRGDVDGSGAINALDVMKLARYVKNSEKYPLGEYLSRGDVDGSGSINALDVMKLARYVKNSEKYPLN